MWRFYSAVIALAAPALAETSVQDSEVTLTRWVTLTLMIDDSHDKHKPIWLVSFCALPDTIHSKTTEHPGLGTSKVQATTTVVVVIRVQ